MSRLFLKTAAMTAILLPGAAQATLLDINNPSFEAQQLADGQYVSTKVTGWIVDTGNEGGVYNPPSSALPSVPDGQNTALLGSYQVSPFGDIVTARLSQTLNDTLQANTRYTMSVDVGKVNGYDLSLFTAVLMAGDKILASGTLTNDQIASGGWATLSFFYDSLTASTDPLKIVFQSFFDFQDYNQFPNYRQVAFDNVKLDGSPIPVSGVPEPSTWAMMLFGFGAVGVAMRRRGKKQHLVSQIA